MKRRNFLKTAGLATLIASGSMTAINRLLSPLRALASLASGSTKKVLCLGLDGMDPHLLKQYMAEGVMPNFSKLAAKGDFKVCGTSIPPQSPVAWSNFITGQDSGGHRIYDFIHREPRTLMPMLSISKANPPNSFFKIGKWTIPRDGGNVELLRHGRAFWEYLAEADLDVTVFKMPSNFPPVDCRVRSISGMGTPDILGTYGIFGYYTEDPPDDTDIGGGRVFPVSLKDGRFTAEIPGPPNTFREGNPDLSVSFEVVVDASNPAALVKVGKTSFVLQEGEWSDWVTLQYPIIPHLKNVSGICRFYMMEVRPTFRLYVSPVQIDPSDPAMPICTPEDYSKELVKNVGPFYTQGLPDDTKALDEGIFEDADYISQADIVLAERMEQYEYELDRFRSLDRGFLFFYFNSLDQNSHMFWRNMDPESPMHEPANQQHRDRIRDMYIAMDAVLEKALAAIDGQTVLFAVSDHGFSPFHREFHLNSWLLEHEYLVLNPGRTRADVAMLSGIDWRSTRAYALGINCLYLNTRGREKDGTVGTGQERDALLEELVEALEAVVDPETGRRAIKHAYRTDKVYEGPRDSDGPDIIVGYYRGYRGSNESALGNLTDEIFSDNVLKWSGDHCMAADEVPGILLSNRKIKKIDPSLLDMAPTFLSLFGLKAPPEMIGRDIFA